MFVFVVFWLILSTREASKSYRLGVLFQSVGFQWSSAASWYSIRKTNWVKFIAGRERAHDVKQHDRLMWQSAGMWNLFLLILPAPHFQTVITRHGNENVRCERMKRYSGQGTLWSFDVGVLSSLLIIILAAHKPVWKPISGLDGTLRDQNSSIVTRRSVWSLSTLQSLNLIELMFWQLTGSAASCNHLGILSLHTVAYLNRQQRQSSISIHLILCSCAGKHWRNIPPTFSFDLVSTDSWGKSMASTAAKSSAVI